MPIHDWSQVADGTFHDFHLGWIAELRKALNTRVLPPGYYARAEQVTEGAAPDVLAPQQPTANGPTHPSPVGGGVAVLAPPQATFTFRAEINEYTARQRSIIIRHASGHRVVAIIEVISRGNKASEYAFSTLVTKVVAALRLGIHVLLIDLHPRTPRDPKGIHAAVWEAMHAGHFQPPADRPLTLASYDAGPVKVAYVEPVRPGDLLRAMPLVLESPAYHVPVPLEETNTEAWRGMAGLDHEALGPPG